MLINYQTLVHDSTNALFKFRDNSKDAIENISCAVELFEGDHFLDALEALADNKTLADTMAAESKCLADKTNKLCSLAGDALENATRESNLTAAKKAKLKEEIRQAKMNQALLQKKAEENQAVIAELERKEDDAWRRADKQASRAAIANFFFWG